ncbi:MAG: hypothetical protein OXN97_12325, partial [Bryobacterales bacterium]|nr:hypothetical protein [Bryobacterales bacterium]
MNSGNSPGGGIGEDLASCVNQCRRSQCKEEYLARTRSMAWDQQLLNRFLAECEKRPDLACIAAMIYAEGRAGLANQLLPGIERYLGRYVFDECSFPLPPEPQRPVLVVDNGEGSGGRVVGGKPKRKRKRAAAPRPPGKAAEEGGRERALVTVLKQNQARL